MGMMGPVNRDYFLWMDAVERVAAEYRSQGWSDAAAFDLAKSKVSYPLDMDGAAGAEAADAEASLRA